MKIPIFEQHDSSDCGVACVASICAHYGKDVSISKLRELLGTDAFGTSINGIAGALDKLDFASRCVYVDRESFEKGSYSLPAIARVVRRDGTAHYVAVYSVKKGVVKLMDPAFDIVQKKTSDEFCKDFDGGMILMVPNENFVRSKESAKSMFSSFVTLLAPHKGLFLTAIVISIILTVFGIVLAIFNKILIDNIIPYQEENQLLMFAIVLMVVTITQTLLSAFRTHAVLYLSQKIDIPLMLGYFKHIFRLPMGFFASRKTGDIVTRFQDASIVKDILTGTALTVAIDVAMVTIVGAVLYTTNTELFAITLLMTLISAVLIYCFKKPYRKLNRKSMEQGARLNSQIIESINGVETVKTNSCETHVMDRIETEYIKSVKIGFRGGVLNNIQGSLSSFVMSAGNLAMLVAGGYLVIGGEATLGTLVAFMSLAGYFIDPIGRLVSLQLSIQEADISLKRLAEIYEVEEESDIEEGKDASAIEDGISSVEISDVSFRYGSRPLTLENISMTIAKGQKIAVVGRSGCGKTTLSKLLLKFYTPESGAIRFNGTDAKDIDAFALREKIGCVPQSTELFSGTIKENIVLGLGNVAKGDLDHACERSGCTEFIWHLPAGYDTFLDENGGGLSGGEKQRILIARALLRKPSFMILDEATSNMDFTTERKVYDLIFDKLNGMTMMIIAHRLSTIRKCDSIYVIDGGRIAECGTHEELMKLGGLYKEMWSSQVGDPDYPSGEDGRKNTEKGKTEYQGIVEYE